MPTIQVNQQMWNETYHWKDLGNDWSSPWGSPQMEWYGSILPRIHSFLTVGTILEIAPGHGRWTQYLKEHCQRLIVVDLSEKCIEACRKRFSSDSHIEYHVNDGKSLDMIQDASIEFVFSFDSLVHAEEDVIEAYLKQLAVKLTQNGVGFIHHSNIGEYAACFSIIDKLRINRMGRLSKVLEKCRVIETNTHWRAFSMTTGKFRKHAEEAGLQCISQETINWSSWWLIDCFSVFTRRDSAWIRPNKVVRNNQFMSEAKNIARIARLYAENYFKVSLIKGKRSKLKRIFFWGLAFFFVVMVTAMGAEFISGQVEPKIKTRGVTGLVLDSELGWLPAAGESTQETSEYSAAYRVNEHHMNDVPVEESLEKAKIKILALGDSHTFAVGVSQEEAWPNVLEQMLFQESVEAGTVYNAAAPAYSLGQYLTRFRRLKNLLTPKIVIVGFSSATDVYDLIPPRKGGFVYYPQLPRNYFDIGDREELLEIMGSEEPNADSLHAKERDLSIRAQEFLSRSAFYRRFRRSRLAYWLAGFIERRGMSLWAGIDTALKKNLSPEEQYRWQLAEKLIQQIAIEAKELGAQVALVHIPYLAQIYDEVWEISFGKGSAHDRWIVSERLRAICRRAKIYFVDPMPQLLQESRDRGVWFHYHYDGHPNRDGHQIIAKSIFEFIKEDAYLHKLVTT